MNLQKIIEFDFPDDDQIHKLELNLGKQGPLHMVLNQFLNFTTKNQQPIVSPVSTEIPEEICALYRIGNKPDVYHKVCPHFFTKDENIEPVWSRPLTYYSKLKKFDKFISTDFSIFENMVLEQKRWNSFRNKFLAALFQSLGLIVIPAPSWGDVRDIDFYMEGWPIGSLIAINTTGIGFDKHSRHLFLDGYFAMLEILLPTHILRYGPCIEGERIDISTYYPNDARKEVRYGANRSYSIAIGGVPENNRSHEDTERRIEGHKVLLLKKHPSQTKNIMNSNSDSPIYLIGHERKDGTIEIMSINIFDGHYLKTEINLKYDNRGNLLSFDGSDSHSHSHSWTMMENGDMHRKNIGTHEPLPKGYDNLITSIVNFNKEGVKKKCK